MSSSGDKFVSADCAVNPTVQTGLQFIYFIKRAFKVGEMPRRGGGGGRDNWLQYKQLATV